MPDPTPSSLAMLQERLQAFVLDPTAAARPLLPLLRRRPPGSNPAQRTTGQAAEPATDRAGNRALETRGLEIYHSAYRSRLREALGSVFERTWAYLGDTEFDALCAHYIEATRSRSRNLRDYGATFCAHLRAALPDDPEAAELAAMDWHLHSAFDAPNATALAPDRLATLDEAEWARIGFRFHPAVALARFEWNVLDIWHALDQGRTPPPARRLPAPLGHLFWRGERLARFRSVDAGEYAALQALHRGDRFAAVCERIAGDHPDAVPLIGEWLARWQADELIIALVNLPDPPADAGRG